MPQYQSTVTGNDALTYVRPCEDIHRMLGTQERKVQKKGVESVLSGLHLGEKGGLAQPKVEYDRGTVETFRALIQQLGEEGLAPLLETEVIQPKDGVVGMHTFVVREPWLPDAQSQYARLEIDVGRENGKTGRLHYSAAMTHSCKPDQKIRASGANVDEALWIDVSRVFLG